MFATAAAPNPRDECRGWPRVLLYEVDVFIPKKTPSVLLTKQRPVSLSAIIFRLYGSERFGHLTGWQQKIFPPCLYGGISGRSYDDMLMDAGLDIATHRQDNADALNTIDSDMSLA